MESTIRFLRPNRYRKAVGEIDSQMSFGVHSALVQRGVAEFVAPLVSSGISQPVAVTEQPRRSRTSRTAEHVEENEE